MGNQAIPNDATRLAFRPRGSGRWDHAGSYEIVDVVKRTPQQLTVKCGNGSLKKFWIKDGSEVGGRSEVEPVTPRITDIIQRSRYRGAVQSLCYRIEDIVHNKIAHNADFERLPLSDLHKLHDILKEQSGILGDWVARAAKAAGKTPAPEDESDPSTD